MAWKQSAFVLACGVVISCGPQGVKGSEGESDSASGTGSSTGDAGSASVTASAGSASASAGSNSGSATTTADGGGSSEDDSGPTPDGTTASDDAPATTDDDDGGCPYGTEGCLCDVGAACDDGLECDDEGVCVAPPACRSIDEDFHGDENSAYELEGVACGNGNDLGVIATLAGPETDWFSYSGAEGFPCPEQPGAVVAADITAEVCVYLACVDGDVIQLQCGDGTSDATSPDGALGCCGEDQAVVTNYDCSGIGSGKDVTVWISVGTAEEACADYGLSYGM